MSGETKLYMLIEKNIFLKKLGIKNLKEYKHRIGKKTNISELEKEFNMLYPNSNKVCDCGKQIFFSTNISSMYKRKRITYVGYDIVCKDCSKRGVTLEKMILKYGEIVGNERWNYYCQKQSETNTFAYKKQKYDWTEKQFKAYNLKRSITLENQINLYGIIDGTKRYNDYIEKQRYSGCALEYFKKNYGNEEGTKKYLEINKSKAQTLEAFINRYGNYDGPKKYDEYKHKTSGMFISKISQELFDSIISIIGNNGHTYYGSLNKEFFLYNKKENVSYFYDYVDTIRKKVIEFNGIKFHAKSQNDENFHNPFSNISSKEIYDKDMKKKELIESKGYSFLYIWEDEYRVNKNKEIDKCISFLKDVI